MGRFRAFALAAALAALAFPANAGAPLPPLDLLGSVTAAAQPAANALVIALNLEDFAASQTYTLPDGTFSMPSLRNGIYKIIAVKQGFLPAIVTLVPTQRMHKIVLRLESDKKRASRRDANQEIWELRGSLPKDVLREVDQMLAPQEALVSYEIPRIKGEMVSMTGVTSQPANPAYAQTAVGVQGRIGDNWQLGIRGNIQRFEDPTDEVSFGAPVAESSNMSMELRSSPTDSYRVASTKSTWMYAGETRPDRKADVRAHNFEWEHGATRVQVRYLEQDNIFESTAPGSNLIEIAGDMPVLQTRRNDLGVSLRVTQESVESAQNALRIADVAANGRVELVPSLVLHYGLASRIGVDGQEWAPRTGAQWKLTKSTSVIASAMVKVLDRDPSSMLVPSIVAWTENDRVMPRYAYSLGLVSGKDENNRLSAIVTMTATDAPLRVVFTDGYDQFWDGLSVDSGDVRRDVRLAYRRQFGNALAIDVSTTAGTATQRDVTTSDRQKVYVTGDLQSTFNPTRTTLLVSYREIQQPLATSTIDYRSERINLRMAQSLYLPVDVKLLFGLELARAENSPYLVDTLAPEGTSKKYIGGLALNF